MHSPDLLHQLVHHAAARNAAAPALTLGEQSLGYADLADRIDRIAAALLGLGLQRSERVAVYLEKRFETVAALFGASAAGCVLVPVNPILKAEQVGHILGDCNARVLVTSPQRLAALKTTLQHCHDLRHIVLTDDAAGTPADQATPPATVHRWSDLVGERARPGHRCIDSDLAAILYTSGSTGRPKGVMLSHRNMVAGARSVATYLQNNAGDTLLAALPLSFDAGLSQLTTAFHAGARVALLNYLMPRDVLNAVVRERVTGLTAVAPLWIQLAQLDWPASVTGHLRYFANTGGHMPLDALTRLRERLPRTHPYLMYGLTEAFRATYLPPEQVDQRPTSIGKAIPNAEVLVLREDGSHCDPHEPGELVQRGALVALGYWNNPAATAERFKPLPTRLQACSAGVAAPEIAVYSGDTVRMDEEGYLYFIGRRDDMIKTSGYRVSPTEIEDVLYAQPSVGECIAFGTPHPVTGQEICVIASPVPGHALDSSSLIAACRKHMPAYMVPARIEIMPQPLPRNPNGKIDRQALVRAWRERHAS
ncbi:MAG: acyl-CoA ligase (AMP-forming), exosortase A system-associated [Rhodocyclales bacterium]|nr:acyl-CoA ligase (AMP-forming), exosortase A system-associated [Rhodocyclales bacterium]